MALIYLRLESAYPDLHEVEKPRAACANNFAAAALLATPSEI